LTTPQVRGVVVVLATGLLCGGAFFAARMLRWTTRHSVMCAASAPLFVFMCAGLLSSYLPDSAALRDQVLRRFEVASHSVSSDRFAYAGTVVWDECLGSLRREDLLTLSYDQANALDERQRKKGGAGLEQILGAQLPGGMRVVREWTDIRVSRTRQDKQLVPYWANDTLRWPLPAATDWVGSVRVPTIRRSDRLLLPAEDATIELRAPAGCIATTFPAPLSVERSAQGDRFVVPVGRPTFSSHAASHLGQDPDVVSLALMTPSAANKAWAVALVDRFNQWPWAWIALFLGLAVAYVVVPSPRPHDKGLLAARLTREVAV
jgi:hypothetical protein